MLRFLALHLNVSMASTNDVLIFRHVNPDLDALNSAYALEQYIKDNHSCNVTLVNEDNIEECAKIKGAVKIVLDSSTLDRVVGSELVDNETFKIDHHPVMADEDFVEYSYVDTNASSTSEIIYNLIKIMGGNIEVDTLAYIYKGIYGDTGRLKFSTKPSTYRTLYEMTQEPSYVSGMFEDINRELEMNSRIHVISEGIVLNHLKWTESGRLNYAILHRDDVDSQEQMDICKLYVNSLQSKEAEAWLLLMEDEDGTYRASLRSKGKAINEFAKRYNGGGHPLASGFTVETKDDIDNVLSELDEYLG